MKINTFITNNQMAYGHKPSLFYNPVITKGQYKNFSAMDSHPSKRKPSTKYLDDILDQEFNQQMENQRNGYYLPKLTSQQ